VPIVDGQVQKNGRQYAGDSSYADGVFTVEMHAAYGIDALTSLTRQFRFDEGGITLTDTYAFDGDALPAVERFIARIEPKLTPAGVEVGGLTLEASAQAVISEGEEPGLWCIDYALPAAWEFTLRVKA